MRDNVLERRRYGVGAALLLAATVLLLLPPAAGAASRYVVLGANDLGMHCYQRGYGGFMILPPANTLKIQVFRKGAEGATLVRRGIKVQFRVVNNTYSVGKTDFWAYAADYGFPVAKNVGITGTRLKGTMKLSKDGKYWVAEYIPVTPYNDRLVFNPLQVAYVTVRSRATGKIVATQPKVVLPVSDEMRCDLCHGPVDTAQNILQAHDTNSGTHLVADLTAGSRHACSECHKDNVLGAPGTPTTQPLSQAMHGWHADKMLPAAPLITPCYACHPGANTRCLRGAMAQVGLTCTSAGCHGSMAEVADSQGAPTNREAWLQEPKCGGCHGAKYAENAATLYRNSYLANGPEGMNGKIMCESCHGSPHAEWPSLKGVDNALPLRVQGLATFIKKCTACHGGESGGIHGNTGG